ncbi:hypothetical protein BST47_01520 [Mycolicibacterium tusciae]|uniref:HNH endonuclease n=1 Tax=Mycolicibacterium tusciae TaxID=75922 RepID=A0A1X0K0D8_9MYCO|nr:hypothetical protein BST47_01520 [Mycolicibacterium tusciae]
MREVAKTAKLKPLDVPADDDAGDPGYRPSAKTKELIQWRDLTCRWPGCDKPVAGCDVDHTVPYPDGSTHPSNYQALLSDSPGTQELHHSGYAPFAGHALERVSATLFEFEP